MTQFLFHYGIHFLFPFLAALLFYKKDVLRATLILLAGILLDVDHLLADPIFDPHRCSINFHPLHSYWAMGAYLCLLIPIRTRIWGLAFMIHMLADGVDCLFIYGKS